MNNSCIIIFFVINSSWWCPWMLISSPIHHDKPQLKSHFPMVNAPFPMVRGFAPLPVLDLGHVHQAIRCGTILQGHRHEGAEGRSACHHAVEPLLTSLGKSWKGTLRWKHEELPNQWVNKHPGTIFELLALWKHVWDAWATGWRRDEVPWSAMCLNSHGIFQRNNEVNDEKWWTHWDLPRGSDETWWTRMNQVETSQ